MTDVVDPAAALDAMLRCPETGAPLRREGEAYVAPSGRRWPIVRGVPRFVPDEAYATSFGFEWNAHATTQLDSRTGASWSRETLQAKTGLEAADVRGRVVLDAGAGAGRFSEVLAGWGAARVVAVDLSRAVEAARENLRAHPGASVVQADIARLPFAPETFDLIVSIGVLHHTSDTRAHLERLVPLLRPGGALCVWVYPPDGDYLKRRAWSPFTRRLPPRAFHRWCRWFVPLVRRRARDPLVQYAAQLFPISAQGLGLENDVLDTFDAYSPRYHWLHAPEEVVAWLRAAGLVDVRALPWRTAVRGVKPGR